jgi:hypothetical protein
MSLVVSILVLLLLLVFVPISLLPVLFSQQDYDSLVQMQE